MRTDSQQENGILLGSNGPTTPTPHKFNPAKGAFISEFDPMTCQKPDPVQMRKALVDNFLQT